MAYEFKNDHPLTEWGKSVRHRLVDLNRTDAWLINRIQNFDPNKKTFMDTSWFVKILNGRASSAPKVAMIEKILAEEESRQEAAHDNND